MENEILLREFMQKVWNEKDSGSIKNYVADHYTVHIDTGDPWEGKTLDHAAFAIRLNYSFDSFPDIHFEVQTAIADGNYVAITWVMTGTNSGKIGGFAATNKAINANGMTIYHFDDGKICGHTQVFDRITIMKQMGFM